ncbi:uncharacterized protein A1O9_03747 [Exophiala aquamarina CBS 119918]|uniref:Extracellular membrane protein CFEM domain-containing protein n=1 Tax=Exophiala aquamarina CBS 119918 TaxID=1182545 RepID=A0A072PFL0_9EURO|nr:uncharacterized protein A1O9_03747 [Exophiala aquamarina CBS 119918]KEF58904.1 hypothetical protein A1O9_03747 [Exophiala aquamarina CBS 119918]
MVCRKQHPVLLLLCNLVFAHTFLLHPRHDDDSQDHDDSSHSGTSSAGAGHDMSHGAFNFTPSGIEWPQCLRDWCASFFDFFPEPVNSPLCANQDFSTNVTNCVAGNCTAYEQGAYVVVASTERPTDRDDPVIFTEEGTIVALVDAGGEPQNCTGVDNSTIMCNSGTQEGNVKGSSASINLAGVLPQSVDIAVLFGLFAYL